MEARDYMSIHDLETHDADSELQHDLQLTAELSFRLPLRFGGRR